MKTQYIMITSNFHPLSQARAARPQQVAADYWKILITHVAQIFLRGRVRGDVDVVDTQRGHHLQGKGEAELAFINSVDQDLRINMHAIRLQAQSKFLVADAGILAVILDDPLRFSFVIRAGVHGVLIFFACHKSFSIYPATV